MFGMGAPELLIILLLVVLLFGAAKIPELGRSLGTGLTNFKRGLKEADDADRPKPDEHSIRVEAKTTTPEDKA
jgi:sec-independent protein translocase protein TatA